ncbi:MFS transporter [Lentzea sp. NPDC051213]|uniref:MFS transporter n=1 Tax=Lentzea sp. NPDC051213 TaxID=3364126 RepID=UPI0037A75E6B
MSAWGFRDFRFLWGGRAISLLGSWLLVVAVPAHVYALTGSMLATGLTLAAEYLPALVLGPVAGVLVDRWDRRRVMIAADLVRAAAVAGMLVGTPAAIYAAVVAESVGAVVFRPAAQALVPAVVGTGDALGSANSWNAATDGVVRLLGPPLGGVLLVWAGFEVLVGLDVASYLVSAVAVAMTGRRYGVAVRAAARRRAAVGEQATGSERTAVAKQFVVVDPELALAEQSVAVAPELAAADQFVAVDPEPAATDQSATDQSATDQSATASQRAGLRAIWHEFLCGLRALRDHPPARALLPLTGVFLAANASLSALLIPLGAQHLGGTKQIGAVLSALGAGFLIGAALVRQLDHLQPRALLAAAQLATAAGFVALFTARSLTIALPAAVVIGTFGSITLVGRRPPGNEPRRTTC